VGGLFRPRSSSPELFAFAFAFLDATRSNLPHRPRAPHDAGPRGAFAAAWGSSGLPPTLEFSCVIVG